MSLTESVVTVIYTWEQYVGNQSNLFLLWVGSSETTREAPLLCFLSECIALGEYIVQPGRKLLYPNNGIV